MISIFDMVWRPKSVKTIDSTGQDTGKGYKYRFLFIFLTACFTSVSVFYNQSLLCK